MTIIGIDPGTVRVGFGILVKENGKLTCKEYGLLNIPKNIEEKVRLLKIEEELKKIIKKTKPDIIGIEKLFFLKNKKTALSVAEARGVILKNLIEKSIPFVEFSPSEIKLAITGNGNASKEAVAKMVKQTLCIKENKKIIDDATDALAIAITTSFYKKWTKK